MELEKIDFWLVKTDSQGNKEWSQTYGGTESDSALSMIQNSDRGTPSPDGPNPTVPEDKISDL